MPFTIKLLFAICFSGITICSLIILLLCIIILRATVVSAYHELSKTAKLLEKDYLSEILTKELEEVFNYADKLYNRYKMLFRKNKQKDFERVNNSVKHLISINSNVDIN